LDEDEEEDQDVDLAFTNLVWILGRTPNLKILNVIDEEIWDISLEGSSSLPPLNQLVSLHLDFAIYCQPLPLLYLELIKAYGAQITNLNLGRRHTFSRDIAEYLPKITLLALKCDHISQLHSVDQVGWKVGRLSLNGHFSEEAHKVFEAIGRFGKSVIELKVDSFGHLRCKNHQETPSVVKPMSKLKILRICNVILCISDHDWAWCYLKKMCKQLEQLHFESKERIIDREKTAARAFCLVPTLKIVVFWEYAENKDGTFLCKKFTFKR